MQCVGGFLILKEIYIFNWIMKPDVGRQPTILPLMQVKIHKSIMYFIPNEKIIISAFSNNVKHTITSLIY
jgi:hypothetical protein